MFAIGNEELDQLEFAVKFATCPKCREEHVIQYGEELIDGVRVPSRTLGFVTCPTGGTYLVSVEGKLLNLPK